jgi:hypothetical protein
MQTRRLLPLALTLVALSAASAEAQGKGKGKNDGAPAKPAAKPAAKPDLTPKGGNDAKPATKATVVISYDRAVDVTRQVLVEKGYGIERVEVLGDTRVIYYYRGNRGRGRGRGPLMRMVVRRVEDRWYFDDAPSGLSVDINVRLKL